MISEVSDGQAEVHARVQARGGQVGEGTRGIDTPGGVGSPPHENVLRKWVRNVEAHREQAFPGQGRMRPDDPRCVWLMIRAMAQIRHPTKERGAS
jgi:hypothetical protein